MQNLIKIISLTILINSCRSENSDNISAEKCLEPKFRTVQTEQGCHAQVSENYVDTCSYSHTLMLNNYAEKCFYDYDYIYMADKYLDSINYDLPVRTITFVMPFDFEPEYDSRDNTILYEHSLISINYNEEDMNYVKDSMKNRLPKIGSIMIIPRDKKDDIAIRDINKRKEMLRFYHTGRK